MIKIFKAIISTLVTFFVVFLLLTFNLASAINFDFNMDSQVIALEEHTFNIDLNLSSSEYNNLESVNIQVIGNNEEYLCNLDKNGDITDICDDFYTTMIYTLETGNGYGYGYGYGYSNNDRFLINYEIGITADETFEEKEYEIIVKINNDNQRSQTFKVIPNPNTNVFEIDNFDVNINDFLTNDNFKLRIQANKKIDGRFEITPKFYCFSNDISIPLRNDFELPLIEFNGKNGLDISFDRVNDFKVNFPQDVDCKLELNIKNQLTGQELNSRYNVKLEKPSPLKRVIEEDIRPGEDLSNYIMKGILNPFTKGYNTLDYRFRNTNPVGLKAEFNIVIPELGLEHNEQINVPANSETSFIVPMFISDETNRGSYPVRITYRINDGDIKTKYGYILIN